jgi:uncharacterized ion transporter superfamily protein YfcC
MKKIPDVFTNVIALIVLAAAATWVVPGGSYQRQKVKVGESTRTVLSVCCRR